MFHIGYTLYGTPPRRLIDATLPSKICKPDRTASAGRSASASSGRGPSGSRPNLRALAVYLLVFQHVPVARTAQLIADVTGVRPSTGWISSVLLTVADVLVDVEKLIKSLIVLAHVIHVDETSANINGARWWLHVASTDKLTAYHLHPSRGRTAVTEFDVLPAFGGTVVHDALSVYDSYHQARHALCGAHIGRELVAAAEADPDQAWPEQALRALYGLNTAAHQARDQQLRRSHRRSPIRCSRYVDGRTKLPEFVVWHAMVQRCIDPNSKDCKNYGGPRHFRLQSMARRLCKLLERYGTTTRSIADNRAH